MIMETRDKHVGVLFEKTCWFPLKTERNLPLFKLVILFDTVKSSAASHFTATVCYELNWTFDRDVYKSLRA